MPRATVEQQGNEQEGGAGGNSPSFGPKERFHNHGCDGIVHFCGVFKRHTLASLEIIVIIAINQVNLIEGKVGNS